MEKAFFDSCGTLALGVSVVSLCSHLAPLLYSTCTHATHTSYSYTTTRTPRHLMILCSPPHVHTRAPLPTRQTTPSAASGVGGSSKSGSTTWVPHPTCATRTRACSASMRICIFPRTPIPSWLHHKKVVNVIFTKFASPVVERHS